MVPFVMTAEQAIELLVNGNREYMASEKAQGDISSRLRLKTSYAGQHPYAIIVTCSDSRVAPEFIFSASIGDLFVIRVAGNVIDDHQLGSIEYAAEHLGCPLILVLGHNRCGAVDAAINHENDGYIRFITDEIKKAIGSETDELKACCRNALYSCMRIEESFQIMDDEKKYGLKVVGAIYHIEDGSVEILGNTREMKEKFL